MFATLLFIVALLGNSSPPAHQDGNSNRPIIGQRVVIETCRYEISPGVSRPCTQREHRIGRREWLRRYGETSPQRTRREVREDIAETRRDIEEAEREIRAEARRARSELRRDMQDLDEDMREVERETGASPRRRRR